MTYSSFFMPKTMSKLLKSMLQTAQIENISWKIQSAVVLALVGISSKIYLGRLKCYFYSFNAMYIIQ